LKLPLAEISAKVRSGPVLDDEEDYALPVWAGIVPLHLQSRSPHSAMSGATRRFRRRRNAAKYKRWKRGELAANGAKKTASKPYPVASISGLCSTSDRPNTSKSKRTAELVPSKFARDRRASSNFWLHAAVHPVTAPLRSAN